MVSDPIGDFLVRLTNAGAVKKTAVSMPYSQFKHAVADKLKEVGFITSVDKKGKKVTKTLEIVLSYDAAGKPRISGARRISKPGRRMYRAVNEIHSVRYGRGALILSTPQGVMTDKDAKKANVGGEAQFAAGAQDGNSMIAHTARNQNDISGPGKLPTQGAAFNCGQCGLGALKLSTISTIILIYAIHNQ